MSAAVSAAQGPWTGVRVLDLSEGIAGAFAARTLAGLGADVVKVLDLDSQDPLLAVGATVGNGIDRWSSAFAAHNLDKRVVRLALGDAAGRAELDALLGRADVLIDSADAVKQEEIGIGSARLARAHPHLLHATTTPFGSAGPYAHWSADDLVLHALAGWMGVQGERGAAPQATGTDVISIMTGNAVVVGLAAALLARDRDGLGQHLEARAFEVAVACQIFDTVAYSYTGLERPRRANDIEEPWAVLDAADGSVAIARSAMRAWEELWLPVFGDEVPDWVLDASVPADGQAVRAALERLVRARPKRELVELCQLLGHIVGEVLTVGEVLDSPQHAARGFFDDVDVCGTRLRVPGPPARFERTPWSRARMLPRSSTGAAVLAGWRPRTEPARAGRAAADPTPILNGVRVLDFTMGWAGPFATELLADLGADVVKVESVGRTDWWRTARRLFTGGLDDPDWLWEASPLWNSVNESKRGITLDLGEERCRAIARELVAAADIIVENFTPRVMTSFGLGPEHVRAINPRAVMISMPGFGADGPWGQFRSTALVTESMAGLTGRVGTDGGMPQIIQMSPADPNAGLVAAWAALSALRVVRRGGAGQHIEVAQVEAMTHHLAAELIEYQLTGSEPPRRANTSPAAAVSGCWQAAGDDEWIVLSATGAAQLAALEEVTGTADPARLGAVLRGIPARAAAEALQAAGVAAADVRTARAVFSDPHLRACGFFHRTERAHVGAHDYPSAPLRFARTPLRERTPAPTLGAQTAEVLHEWIGVSDELVDALADAGLIGTEPRGTDAGRAVRA